MFEDGDGTETGAAATDAGADDANKAAETGSGQDAPAESGTSDQSQPA